MNKLITTLIAAVFASSTFTVFAQAPARVDAPRAAAPAPAPAPAAQVEAPKAAPSAVKEGAKADAPKSTGHKAKNSKKAKKSKKSTTPKQ